MMFGYGFGIMGLGMVALTLVWVALIAVGIWALLRLVPRDHRSERDIAREVLQRRFAAGEISDAEYQQAVKFLG
jgi:putative membrane protein